MNKHGAPGGRFSESQSLVLFVATEEGPLDSNVFGDLSGKSRGVFLCFVCFVLLLLLWYVCWLFVLIGCCLTFVAVDFGKVH